MPLPHFPRYAAGRVHREIVSRELPNTRTFDGLSSIVYHVERQVKTLHRRIRVGACIVGLFLFAAVISFSSMSPSEALQSSNASSMQGYGSSTGVMANMANVVPTCGHPQAVIAKLLPGEKRTLSSEQLKQLPTPAQKQITLPGDATYDPGKDRLCAGSYVALYTLLQKAASDATPGFSFASTGQDIVSTIVNGFLQGACAFLKGILDWANTYNFFLNTPAQLTYGNPAIINLVGWSVTAVNAGIGFYLIIGGYNYLFGEYSDFRQLAPRFVLALVAANFCLPVLGQFVELMNALCAGLLGELAHAGHGSMTLPLAIVNIASLPEYEVVVYLIELICSLLLVLQMLLRIALLCFELTMAPFGFLCLCLPQTRKWGQLWGQIFISALVVQFLQISCIGVGAVLIASWGHFYISIIDAQSSPIILLVGIATTTLAYKIPDWLLSSALRANAGNDLGKQIIVVVKTAAEMAALAAA
ncbi:conjugal transfer protein TrbL family protein [Dictyobacter formicarum]|uniref:Uncharacterized protein n=1 Tax=Dictyobacter formicarum TaxID=2778368 RepID=A0ABQ3VR15_9CHLR|nr:conjugal transfer protein TrbL family protein [Dictyobacter formicarum]GHO88161.1 hypothetical protein KSZ_61670 [Dictyobacter formicarum]